MIMEYLEVELSIIRDKDVFMHLLQTKKVIYSASSELAIAASNCVLSEPTALNHAKIIAKRIAARYWR